MFSIEERINILENKFNELLVELSKCNLKKNVDFENMSIYNSNEEESLVFDNYDISESEKITKSDKLTDDSESIL